MCGCCGGSEDERGERDRADLLTGSAYSRRSAGAGPACCVVLGIQCLDPSVIRVCLGGRAVHGYKQLRAHNTDVKGRAVVGEIGFRGSSSLPEGNRQGCPMMEAQLRFRRQKDRDWGKPVVKVLGRHCHRCSPLHCFPECRCCSRGRSTARRVRALLARLQPELLLLLQHVLLRPSSHPQP